MQKRKKYGREKKRRNNVLILFLIVVPILMCLMGMGMQYYIVLLINGSVEGTQLGANDAINTSVLDTIMSTISIAVSVWIGLNIYNVYKREDVDSALDKMQSSMDEMAYEGEKRKFIWQLEKGEYMYEINRYFCVEFEQEDSIPLDILSQLTEFEKNFYWCYSSYERREDKECLIIAKKLLEETNNIFKVLDKYFISEKTLLFRYVSIREADLLFYKNKVSGTPDVSELLKSIENYKRELDKIPQSEMELYGYMENTIGYSYHLIYQSLQNESGKVRGKIPKKSIFNYFKLNCFLKRKESADSIMEYYSSQTEYYMSKAVKHNKKGRYLQNLGAYYEIIKKDYDTALSKYMEALNAERKDEKIYNLIGAVLLKKVDKELEIERRFNDNKTLLDIANKLTSNNANEVKDMIVDAYNWLSYALSVNNPIMNAYYNFSKAGTYYFLFVDKDEVILEEAYKRLKMVETYWRKETGKKKIGFLYTFRNYYEAKEDYQKAKEKNSELMTLISDGDNLKKADLLYTKKLD